MKDIAKFTENAMKRSKGAEDTKNLGFLFWFWKASYLACSDDYDMIFEASQIIK